MEYRTNFYTEEVFAIYDENDPEKIPYDQRVEHKDFTTQKEAELFAKKQSSLKKVDYPIRVYSVEQYREPCEIGYTWKDGMGWHNVDEAEPKILSAWWENEQTDF